MNSVDLCRSCTNYKPTVLVYLIYILIYILICVLPCPSRPQVLIGRKNAGVLECHANGFRFTTSKGAKGDIIFANIKHAFYQEASDQSPAVP